MRSKLLSWPAIVILAGCLWLFLLLTDPNKLPIVWLILPFLLVFVLEYLLILKLLTRRRRPLTRRRMLIAGASAVVLTGLLVLSSLNQLTVKDVIIMLILGLGLVWYGHRLDLGS